RTDNREVYALVKLLELHFQTTLGFPRKFCNSANMYRCSLSGRVQAWMSYLAQQHLLRQPHDQPVSFTVE
ncbi:hypothetical protein, partial [Hymenobacter sp. AT01-02]|uniref:hypothetical protein n=1 Tax=Hymenobacter sp. AT01-02 TaxID=1571877 RepID=UPI000B0A9FBD